MNRICIICGHAHLACPACAQCPDGICSPIVWFPVSRAFPEHRSRASITGDIMAQDNMAKGGRK